MASQFGLAIYPWVYLSQWTGAQWEEHFEEKPHRTPEEESLLPADEREDLYQKRNRFAELPLVNYTTQYGMGCFEGLKAFPQPDGELNLFRPLENGRRMARSMAGLYMPEYPPEAFVDAVREVVARNKEIGFAPDYDPAWEADDFVAGASVYVRPFSYAEGGIGVNLSHNPWLVIVSTRVGSYFAPSESSPTATTARVRANPGGTGWIKCNSNYVTSALAKTEAEAGGFIECVFLDATEHRCVEEGSSCNLFFVLDNDTLVTPELGDTVLPGITRASVMELARDWGVTVEERRLPIEEAMDRGVEFFGTGTAAGVTHFSSLAHGGREKVFGDGSLGQLTQRLLRTLKGIQYGAQEDTRGWMVPCTRNVELPAA
jgi:branched-chain amino acid aminotransferase